MKIQVAPSTNSLDVRLIFVLGFILFSLDISFALANEPRPMRVQIYESLGLEFWTEKQPKWTTELHDMDGKPVLFATSPPKNYPPLSMSVISFNNMNVIPEELDDIYDGFINTALPQYGLDEMAVKMVTRTQIKYGDLTGIELNFQGYVHGDYSDIKVFLGKGNGRGLVLLQAYTLPGKMKHVSGQLRRSWGNIKLIETGNVKKNDQ